MDHQERTRSSLIETLITSQDLQNSEGYLVEDFMMLLYFGVLILWLRQENCEINYMLFNRIFSSMKYAQQT